MSVDAAGKKFCPTVKNPCNARQVMLTRSICLAIALAGTHVFQQGGTPRA
jgi:hypothetical protein